MKTMIKTGIAAAFLLIAGTSFGQEKQTPVKASGKPGKTLQAEPRNGKPAKAGKATPATPATPGGHGKRATPATPAKPATPAAGHEHKRTPSPQKSAPKTVQPVK